MKLHVEWGRRALDVNADVVVIVDCLSFSTAVCVAVANGALVYPFGFKDDVINFANKINIACAVKRGQAGMCLSPASLDSLGVGDEIILPSPNGSHLSLLP